MIAIGGRDPIAVCAEAWRAGKVGPTPPPALVACVLPSGTVGVFPADTPTNEVCAGLGLAPAAPNDPAGPTTLAALRSTLTDRFRAACVSLDEARAIALNELTRYRLTGWTVTISSGATPERRCASLGIDEPGHRILLIPAPG